MWPGELSKDAHGRLVVVPLVPHSICHTMKQLLWIALAIFAGAYICNPVGDPDLWWHITVGRWIIAHGEVPSVDLWNLFSAGAPWRAYSWSVEVLFAAVERMGGGWGLAALQLAFALALSLTLFYSLSRLARDSFMGAILGMYTTVACFNHFTLRPQSLVWIMFALAIVAADVVADRGASRKALAALVALGCVWANTHLTAILGLGAVFLWSVQDSQHRFQLRRASAAAGCFFAGTLLTPYFGGEWLTFFSKGGHPLQYNVIAEFQPATILQYSTVFVVLMGAILIAAFQGERAAPPPSRMILGAGMTLAGLTAVKFLPFASIALGAMCAAWWRQSGHQPQPKGGDHLAEGLRQMRRGVLSLDPKTVNALTIFVVGMASMHAAPLFKRPINRDLIPESTVDFIEQAGLSHPILNEFGTGGYLMYRFSDRLTGEPGYKVAIDGRTNVNPPEVWELYRASFMGRANWDDYIKKVGPETVLWRQGSPMTSLLLLSPEWCRVYASGSDDESFVVFIKRSEFDRRRGSLSSIDCS